MVLIPKKEVTTHPKDFRLISLQNCLPKITSKVMMSCLQRVLPNLIHSDQTGFIKGRCIPENFVYATKLVQCCHKRKVLVLILKLNFCKAFDSINWSAMDGILRAKGFPTMWRHWVVELNGTGLNSVLLNGNPGNWFQCLKGLRQGDPLSPYLFILVTNLLQRMIQEASSDGRLHHPLCDDLPCPVLQYADHTLIILQAEQSQIQLLKEVLSSFST